MSNLNQSNLSCRHCRYYRPEGQRGGQCQMLSVPVRGVWSACLLVVPVFTASGKVPAETTREQPQPLEIQR